MTRYYGSAGRRLIQYGEVFRSDTDGGAGLWCAEAGKYVKSAGQVGGITHEAAKFPVGKPKYATIPISLGELDS